LSVRLKLTLSYAGFLMVAGALLLAATYAYLTRGRHVGLILVPGYEHAVPRGFAPIAAIVMAFLLVFGLLGGWILAGRMLAPLVRITDATRTAATGSLSHRIQTAASASAWRSSKHRPSDDATLALTPRRAGGLSVTVQLPAAPAHTGR
jgi:two-component system sensor histidine kinase VanS